MLFLKGNIKYKSKKHFIGLFILVTIYLTFSYSTVALTSAWSISFHLVLCFFTVLGFEARAYTLCHSNSPFCFVKDFFWDRASQTICPGWLQAIILLISASWVARIDRREPLAPSLILFWNILVILVPLHLHIHFRITLTSFTQKLKLHWI
jgi:hypothetical protein